MGRGAVMKFVYSPWTKKRRKTARKCRRSIVDPPHVSLRLLFVVSNADNDEDDDDDDVANGNEEVIT
jgi:hypothetical protein